MTLHTPGSTLDERMRTRERFHHQIVPYGMWFVVRVDGRSFTTYAKTHHLQRPFDDGFHDHMLHTTRTLLNEFNGTLAYTQSDEISVLFPPDWNDFHRSTEKIVSLTAATASVAFSTVTGHPATFDSRIWLGIDRDQVVDYFTWRTHDAYRGALNTWAYWTLRHREQLSGSAATRRLTRATHRDKKTLLLDHGIVFDDVPAWQQHGTVIRWETFDKPGVHGLTGQPVTAQRRRLTTLDAATDIPMLIRQELSDESPASPFRGRLAGRGPH